MKPLLILLLAPGIALASPPELKDLQAKRAAKIAEIDRIYASELEKLQEKLMKRGDLAGANKVEGEIRKVVGSEFSSLIGTWRRDSDGGLWEITSTSAGVFNKKLKFRIRRDNAGRNAVVTGDGWEDRLSFTDDPDVVRGEDRAGNQFFLTREK